MPPTHPDDAPVYTIAVAAALTGLHPQTLRQYDRLGLVTPARVGGRNRLYSVLDIARLREIAELSADGVSLSGVRRMLELQDEVERLRRALNDLHHDRASKALVVWRPGARRA